jgi:hypothetical protein
MIRLAIYAFTIWISLILAASGTPPPSPLVVEPPPDVNMQLEGTSVLQDGACVTYYKTRDRGDASQSRPSRGDLVWKVQDGQSVVVLEPGRSVTDGNGVLGVENGWGSLYVVDKNNKLLRYPIPEWVPVRDQECVAP